MRSPRSARAQQGERVRRLAILEGTAETAANKANIASFMARLDELGWKNGRNIRTDLRWWTAPLDQMRVVIAEMLAASPDIILVDTNLALTTLKPMVLNVPVVFMGVGDPVGSGFVASIAHPGGNITGFSSYDGPMGGKWLEVLKETAPSVTRMMTLLYPETETHQAFWRSIEDAAPRFGVEATAGAVHDATEIERVISSFGGKPNSGLIVLPHAVTAANRGLIVDLGLRYRLPSVHGTAGSAADGGLVYYGIDFGDSYRHAAEYVDRILRGEKPADLPVQLPTKFKLIFNLKTATAIGITIPPSMLVRADEVIE
ncbi:MAG: ABC transporter substrate-binding protein [Xanthobacteraceae bacterium]|jgi:putative ABC transport system substrate-binding protein